MPTVHSERTELLHVKQVAELLDQHEVSVRRHIAAGRLHAVRLGPHGRVRVPREALAEFLQPYRRKQPP
jgi:excisionase family DNA binding protein